jgi:hypothetical protein
VNWSALNPNPPAASKPYDWTYLDDAFGQASAWNVRNPTKDPKTIQIVPLPGFQAPEWLLAQIPSCDGLFRSPMQTPPSTCGKVTVAGFVEGKGVRELPLPWNALYKRSWRTFLTALAARYESNPAFVSRTLHGMAVLRTVCRDLANLAGAAAVIGQLNGARRRRVRGRQSRTRNSIGATGRIWIGRGGRVVVKPISHRRRGGRSSGSLGVIRLPLPLGVLSGRIEICETLIQRCLDRIGRLLIFRFFHGDCNNCNSL